MIGGVVVDMQGQTSLPGLWAAGEVTSSGLHGANRLASNSLLEGLVYGARAGQGASLAALDQNVDFEVAPVVSTNGPIPAEAFDVADVRNAVQSLMWRNVGVQRQASRLAEAYESILGYCRYVLKYPFENKEGWELQNLLTVGMLMTHAARQRRESRGVHLRTDFPQTDDAHWNMHLSLSRDAFMQAFPAPASVS
jgi:L-aspartate oxidase